MGLWKRIGVLFLTTALFSLLVERFPLFNVVGYEFSLATGAVLYLVSAWMGWFLLAFSPSFSEQEVAGNKQSVGREGACPSTASSSGVSVLPSQNSGPDFLWALSLGLWLLLILDGFVLGLGLLNGFFVKNCDESGGIKMFGFIAIPASFLGLSTGFLSGSITKSFWKATGIITGFAFLSALFSFLEHYTGPRVSLHNLILGQISFYFYSSSTKIFPTFFYHRYFTLGLSLLMLTVAYIRMAGKNHHPAQSRVGYSFFWLILLLTVIPAVVFSDEMGLTSGGRLLRRRLKTTIQSAHIRLHYSPSDFSVRTVKRILGELEWAYEQNATALNLNLPWKVEAYLYPWSVKEELTGGGDVLFAKPWRHEIHITSQVDEILLRHELVHTMSADFGRFPYGVPYNFSLIEGLAEAVSRDMGTDIQAHSAVAGALQSRTLPDPARFMTNRGFLSHTPYQVYQAAGSFVGFLLHTYGTEPVKNLYRGSPYLKAFSKSLPQLAQEWKLFLSQVPVLPEERQRAEVAFSPTYAPVFYARICPREREQLKEKANTLRSLENYTWALKIFQSFHRLEPHNPEWLLELAQTEFQKGDTRSAQAHLKEIFDKNYPPAYRLRAYQLQEFQAAEKNDHAGILQALTLQESLITSPYPLFIIQLKKKALSQNDGLDLYFAIQSPCGPQSFFKLYELSRDPRWQGLLLLLLPCDFPLKSLKMAESLQNWIIHQKAEWKEIYAERVMGLGDKLYYQNQLEEAEKAYQLALPFTSSSAQKRLNRLLQKASFIKHFSPVDEPTE